MSNMQTDKAGVRYEPQDNKPAPHGARVTTYTSSGQAVQGTMVGAYVVSDKK